MVTPARPAVFGCERGVRLHECHRLRVEPKPEHLGHDARLRHRPQDTRFVQVSVETLAEPERVGEKETCLRR